MHFFSLANAAYRFDAYLIHEVISFIGISHSFWDDLRSVFLGYFRLCYFILLVLRLFLANYTHQCLETLRQDIQTQSILLSKLMVSYTLFAHKLSSSFLPEVFCWSGSGLCILQIIGLINIIFLWMERGL
jgi:hypothetical protein